VALTEPERRLRARLAAHTKWGKQDPVAGTAKARAAFLERFEREADPNGLLPEDERRRRAQHARKAHFTRLAYLSARARNEKKREQT
jgi:hypothetical protein